VLLTQGELHAGKAEERADTGGRIDDAMRGDAAGLILFEQRDVARRGEARRARAVTGLSIAASSSATARPAG
jgi:hypothetical protein